MKKFSLLVLLIFALYLLPNTLQAAGNYQAGSLLALEGVEGAAVYFIAGDGMKYVFADPKTYDTWYQDFDDVQRVDLEELDQYADGGAMPYRAGTKLVTHENTTKIYAVEPDGILRWISSAEIAESLYGVNWGTMVQDVIPGYFSSSYTLGDDLTDSLPTGTLVKEKDTNAYYYIDQGRKRKFIDTSTFQKNNFNYDYVLEPDDLSAYDNGSDILDKEDTIAELYREAIDDSEEGEEDEDDEPEEIVIRDQKIILLSQAIGESLYEEGNLAQWFADYNTANGTTFDISQREYLDGNNGTREYWYSWVEGGCNSANAISECPGDLAANYDIINFTHGFEASDVLTDPPISIPDSSRKSLGPYKEQYRELRDVMDQYPDTVFIAWTIPPRHPLHSPIQGRRTLNSARASQFADWVKDEWLSEDDQTHSNIYVFDFRDYLTADDNYLEYDYRRAYTWSDSYPNTLANETIAPELAQFIIDTIEEFF